jgi:hypothetical protein
MSSSSIDLQTCSLDSTTEPKQEITDGTEKSIFDTSPTKEDLQAPILKSSNPEEDIPVSLPEPESKKESEVPAKESESVLRTSEPLKEIEEKQDKDLETEKTVELPQPQSQLEKTTTEDLKSTESSQVNEQLLENKTESLKEKQRLGRKRKTQRNGNGCHIDKRQAVPVSGH